MKIKVVLIIFLSVLLLISISQIFSIPPYGEDVFKFYKSGYFSELEKGFKIIKDSFINIKMMSKPAYAWVFLKDIKKEHGIDVKVYNNKGFEIVAPGKKKKNRDERVFKILNSLNAEIYSETGFGKYYTAIPVKAERRCRFCHGRNKKKIRGVISFERACDSYIYYSSERIIIFTLLSIVLAVFMFLVIKWDPGKVSRELFDK